MTAGGRAFGDGGLVGGAVLPCMFLVACVMEIRIYGCHSWKIGDDGWISNAIGGVYKECETCRTDAQNERMRPKGSNCDVR